MSIGTFTHAWKVTQIQKFGSRTVEDSDLSGNITTYTDLVCGVWGTIKTTNNHGDHADESHYIERDCNWQWRDNPLTYMDPVGFVTYANLTESDYVNILKQNGCAGVEDKLEAMFIREFEVESVDVVIDPFGHDS